MIIQLTGLSGCGKTTLSQRVKTLLASHNISVEILDGDKYRQTLCKDLGFSKAGRIENVRRLGMLASSMSSRFDVVIVAAINPYEEARSELKEKYGAKTVWINCDLDELIARDTKGLYRRAYLPDNHPEKLTNLTGVNDSYDIPQYFDLEINTHLDTVDDCCAKLFNFIRGLL